MPDLGFRVTEKLTLNDYGIFGEHVMQSANLSLALRTFIAQMGVQSNCPPFWLKEDDDGTWFCRLGTQGIKVGNWPIEQHVVSMMIQLIRGFTSTSWTPDKVYLQTNTLEGSEHTNTLINSDIKINKAVTAVFIDDEILLSPPRKLNSQSSNFIEQSPIATNVSQLVTCVMQQRMDLRPYKIDDIGEALGVSSRQLQRLLKRDCCTFRELAEQTYFEQAKAMLANHKLSIIEIALELGYLDTANFTRAFKRWAGLSPRQYQKLAVISYRAS